MHTPDTTGLPAVMVPIGSVTAALHSALQDVVPDVKQCFIGIVNGRNACSEEHTELYDLFSGSVRGIFPRLFVYIPDKLSKYIGLIEEGLFATESIEGEDELLNTAFDVIKQETPPDTDERTEVKEEEDYITEEEEEEEEEEDEQNSEEEEEEEEEEEDEEDDE